MLSFGLDIWAAGNSNVTGCHVNKPWCVCFLPTIYRFKWCWCFLYLHIASASFCFSGRAECFWNLLLEFPIANKWCVSARRYCILLYRLIFMNAKAVLMRFLCKLKWAMEFVLAKITPIGWHQFWCDAYWDGRTQERMLPISNSILKVCSVFLL